MPGPRRPGTKAPRADDLRTAGYDVKEGGDSYDVTIRLRDGGQWSPSGMADFEEEDEDDVYGYWTDDEDDGRCPYCGVGLASSGEVCPACGTFQA